MIFFFKPKYNNYVANILESKRYPDKNKKQAYFGM